MKRRTQKILTALFLCLCLFLSGTAVYASSPTDEILKYEITADVNEDATVNLVYHLDWLVLESDGIGPVSWVSVGIPNDKYLELSALSSNISDIYYSDGAAQIYFSRDYYEDEIISFDFLVVSDYLYEINAYQDGLTTYYFTPGWFDEIAVDELVIRWNGDRLESWSGDCLIDGGYNVWTTSLAPGATFGIEANYANDAFSFNENNQRTMLNGSGGYDDYSYDDDYDYPGPGSIIGSIIGGFLAIVLSAVISPVGILLLIAFLRAKKTYQRGSGFASGETEKKITRTKVVYYDACPGCGAPRPEGKHVCPYCGRDLIKSEEVIEEKNVPAEDKEALKYDKKGEYHYSSDPNTFVRVNVVHVPVIHTGGSSRSDSHGSSSRPSGRSGSSGRSGGSSRGGGCAHSSCACACVSCACACACACAGGGRAGCSTKDFYRTDLKLRQIETAAQSRRKNV